MENLSIHTRVCNDPSLIFDEDETYLKLISKSPGLKSTLLKMKNELTSHAYNSGKLHSLLDLLTELSIIEDEDNLESSNNRALIFF